jgi:60 kDa SS-A/Ro ribonucleoprotein
MPNKHLEALARYAVTGTFHGTYYATDAEPLAKVQELVRDVRPELVAKTAIYCRKHGRMKDVPAFLVDAMGRALEHAVGNVPAIAGSVALCPDVSGSMHAPITGRRGSTTSKVRCIDVAALATAVLLRKNERATVLPFSDDVVLPSEPLNALDAVVTNADLLSSLPSGGTACAAPLRWLNARGQTPDAVVFVSDNQSWADFRLAQDEWETLRARNTRARRSCSSTFSQMRRHKEKSGWTFSTSEGSPTRCSRSSLAS